tara:strand:- start:2247 stop:2468 length:222 start_codon:yes stop_codon:yes gene_type:complete
MKRMNNWKKPIAFLVSIVMIGIGTNQLLGTAGLEKFNAYNAGRVSGCIILVALGFMVYRLASKKSGVEKKEKN